MSQMSQMSHTHRDILCPNVTKCPTTTQRHRMVTFSNATNVGYCTRGANLLQAYIYGAMYTPEQTEQRELLMVEGASQGKERRVPTVKTIHCSGIPLPATSWY